MCVASLTLIFTRSVGILQPTRPLDRVGSKFNWASEDQCQRSHSKWVFDFIPHLKSKYSQLIISKLPRKSSMIPEIDWEIPVVKPGCHHKAMCDRLIEITSEHQLEQIQREPTRLANILDLLFTNKPVLVKEVLIMPGLSDHSTVLVDTYLNIKPNIKLPRKISQWSRANWDKMREETRVFREQYFNTTPTQSVDQKSESLTQFLGTLVSKHVPQKVSSSRKNIPWMRRPLHRMCRKK